MVNAAVGRCGRWRFRCVCRPVHLSLIFYRDCGPRPLEPCQKPALRRQTRRKLGRASLPTSRWKMQRSESAVKAWRITPQSQAQTTITPSITSSALLSPHESRKQSFVGQHPTSFHEFAMPHLDSVAFAPHSPDSPRFLTCQTRLLLGGMRQTLGFVLSPVIW